MRNKLVAALIFIVCSLSGFSTHIVGGEFQMVEQRSGLYDIYLNLYFDAANGNPAAKDQFLTAYIYRKSDNTVMDILSMSLQEEVPVEYSNPDCKIPEVSTTKITYAVSGGYQFTVSYNDPAGYYIVWDRCCRNDAIVNIVNPGDAGMLFYLHFPPIFDNNQNLIGWSSPVFNEIPGTYACINEHFTLDFGATDDDGDSLVYSIVEPMVGFSTPNNPVPNIMLPEPYPTVTWELGIGVNNEIPGNPPLSVNSKTGMLSMRPSDAGLHVFGVNCEEFRDGVKIGEVRRDFQIFVYTNCQQNDPPNASVILPDNSLYVEGGSDTIVMFSNDLNCLDLRITDNIDLRNNEKISVSVVPVNFNTSATLVNPGTDQFVSGIGDTLDGWQVCPPNCEDIMEDEPFLLDIITRDDGCPIPKRDTTRIVWKIIPEPNEPPKLFANGDDVEDLVINIYEVDTVTIDFFGTDADVDDVIDLRAVGKGFRLRDFGMDFPPVTGTGTVNGTFQWILDCEYFKNTDKTIFDVDFILGDNSCYNDNPDTVSVRMRINNEVKKENFEIYNIFTPNGDGVNDLFKINALPRDNCEDQYLSFQIFNRWGKRIYYTEDRRVQFDGAELNDGVYYYLVEYTESEYNGWFTILR